MQYKVISNKNGEGTKKYLKAAEKKMNRVCKDLKEGKIRKRGFNKFSNFIGKSQSESWPKIEEDNKSSVKVDDDCIRCNLCVKICPMKNLNSTDSGITHNDNCIICYRCVNACPKKAITVLLHKMLLII